MVGSADVAETATLACRSRSHRWEIVKGWAGLGTWAVAVCLLVGGSSLVGCGSGGSSGGSDGRIVAVGAESQYADVIKQIGGKYVQVSAVESNPNTDPHTFEAGASVAEGVSNASLIVENGLGYDTYMEKIESASPNSARKIIDVQHLLGLPDSTPNPHLWYKPATMPAVARALAVNLAALEPAHAAYFQANARAFEASLRPWLGALARFRARYPGAAVATTEPVGNYMLEAAGTRNLTPFGLQADIMNGTDPAPQDVTFQEALLTGKRVQAFVYNQQVTDPLTQSFLQAAKRSGVAVVGVYETMPTPGYDYQSWMVAEVKGLERAVGRGVSTEKL
jgi:zinc/manganese transport system substrate-binding protein